MNGARAMIAAGLSMLLPAGSAAAQVLGQGQSHDVSWVRVASALLLCLALAAGGAFALRRRLRGGTPLFAVAPRRLQLLESVRAGQHVDLCLIRLDGEEFFIAAGQQGATILKAGIGPGGSSAA